MAIHSEHRSWEPGRETCVALRESTYHAGDEWEARFLGLLHDCIPRGEPCALVFRALADWLEENPRPGGR